MKGGPVMVEEATLRAAIRQQLVGDRLFGMDFVPLPATVLEHIATPAVCVAQERSTRPAGDVADKSGRLAVLNESQVKGCTKCGLAKARTQTVFGQGSANARLVFVGEAPGFEEDRQGLAFVGAAGQLLTRMIVAMGLSRDEVFICNVLKCRPPGNRDPMADEVLACSPYLREQLQIIRPEMLVALGAPAAKTLLNTAESIGRLRGRFHDYFLSGMTGEGESIPLMPTYHPAYLLRNESEKKKTWDDLQKVMARMGLTPPARRARA